MTGLRSDNLLTTLDDIFTLVPNTVNKFNLASEMMENEDYLKVWKFIEENNNPEIIRSLPVSVQDSLNFKRNESYLFLFLFKLKNPRFFPPEVFNDIQHVANLSPKGIKTPFVVSAKNEIEFNIFVSNGKHANPLLKAIAQTRAFELENHLNKYPSVLSTVFSGVYIKNKKILKSETKLLKYSSQKLFHNEFLIWNKFEKTEYLKYFFCSEPVKLFMNPYGVTFHKPKMSSLSLSGIQNKMQEKESILELKNIDEIENLDIRDTTRNELKLEYYNEKISEMAPGVFVAGELVAKNKDLLKEYQITHIINCAGNVLDNFFPDEFKYKKFYLKDSSTSNAECLFYPVIFFIEEALEAGGKVLIHCVQGVSRSVALCMGYLTYKNHSEYEVVLKDCKQNRDICSPNVGFQVQLIWWFKRLFAEFSAIPVCPRVFVICSFDKDQKDLVVAKLIMGQEAQNLLDPRGIFIICNEKFCFVWKGSQIFESNQKIYYETCQKHLNLLRANEKCGEPEVLDEKNETEEFFGMWQEGVKVEKNPEWDDWFVELEKAETEEYSSFSSLNESREIQVELSEKLLGNNDVGLHAEQNIEIISVRSENLSNEVEEPDDLE